MIVRETTDNSGKSIKKYIFPDGFVDVGINASTTQIACLLAKKLMTSSRDLGVKLIADLNNDDLIVISNKDSEVVLNGSDLSYLIN